jgi:3-deoxy-manno-octulosonate cytidylyltransferase (CMP-KDO synthetase)
MTKLAAMTHVLHCRVPVRFLSSLTESSVLAVIPARFQSSRFPGKPLADLCGRPMIAHVYERARLARLIDAVVVATDDERIAVAVRAAGGEAVMTSPHHLTGTDRLAEVASALPCRIVVNVQGDEPLIDPAVIDAVLAPMLGPGAPAMATACRPVRDRAEFLSPHAVKVVTSAAGNALYFSRAPIPAARDATGGVPDEARIHVGLYAYRRDVLLRLAATPPAPLERVEHLEQLRALDAGDGIRVVETDYHSIGVDTPDDLERVRRLLMSH